MNYGFLLLPPEAGLYNTSTPARTHCRQWDRVCFLFVGLLSPSFPGYPISMITCFFFGWKSELEAEG